MVQEGWLLAAEALVLLHFLFVLFVGLGGLLMLRWPRLAWLHLPAAAWGALISFAGWICPLTPLEIDFRQRAGEAGYSGGFIDHYLLPVLYPDGLSRPMQIVLGVAVVLGNAAVYGYAYWRRRQTRTVSSD